MSFENYFTDVWKDETRISFSSDQWPVYKRPWEDPRRDAHKSLSNKSDLKQESMDRSTKCLVWISL